MSKVAEIFIPIKGYEGIYQISNYGVVMSMPRIDSNGRKRGGIILKNKVNKGSKYLVNRISKNGLAMTYSVHRMVAIAFIKNPENKTTVNHIDGDTKNNFVDNLEWATPCENNKHAYANGLIDNKGIGNGRSKLTNEDILKIYTDTRTQREIAYQYGVTQAMISAIKRGANWKHITQQ